MSESSYWFTLSHIQTLSWAADENLKAYWQKEEIALKQAISPFATMLSTLFNSFSYIYWNFPYFCLEVFQVCCCKFDLCGKGLWTTHSLLPMGFYIGIKNKMSLGSTNVPGQQIYCNKKEVNHKCQGHNININNFNLRGLRGKKHGLNVNI